MRSPHRWLATLTISVLCLAGTVISASWSAEPEPVCPPNSQNPRCVSPDPEQTPTDPQPTRRPSEPPGQQPEPTPSQTQPGSPPPGPGGPGGPGPATPTAPPPPPPPPPDLGPVRSFVTRVTADASMVEVEVVEARANGVDGGWTVTVEAGALRLLTVAAEADGAPDQVGALHVRPGTAAPGPRALFTVVGQSSEGEYAGRYRAQATLGPAPPTVRPTITVTLFQ